MNSTPAQSMRPGARAPLLAIDSSSPPKIEIQERPSPPIVPSSFLSMMAKQNSCEVGEECPKSVKSRSRLPYNGAMRGAREDRHRDVRAPGAHQQSAAIEAAERELALARDKDREAMAAPCGFRCATLKEVHVRADYLSPTSVGVPDDR